MVKRIFLLFMPVLFISCQDEWEPLSEADQPARFTYTVSGEGLFTRFAGSRFENGDNVGIYMIPNQSKGTPADFSKIYAGAANVQYQLDGTNKQIPVSRQIKFPSDGSEMNFVAYFPYDANAASRGHKVPVDVSKNNWPLPNMGLLYYNGVGDPYKRYDVPTFKYQSQLTKLTIIVKPASSYNADLSDEPSLSVKGMPTTADFNLSTGRMENLGGTDVPVNLVLNTDRSTKAEAHWEMLVIPHTKDDVQPGSRIFTFSFEGEERKFVWPDNIPFVKGTNATYNFRLTEDFMGITDSDGKTNCIMVKPGYTVMFPVVRAYEGDGASDKLRVDGENYDGEFEEEATVVWSDAEVIGGSKVEGKGKDARVIIDTYPNISGNAVVAIKRKDTGEIVWSYHIWVTKYRGQLTATQNGFTFMDRNLGADKPSLGTDNDVDRTHGLFYQWGRKDPFPSTGKPGDNQAVGKFTAKAASSTVGSIKYTIKHPDEFIYLLKNTTNADWLDNTLWGHDGGKSIYDPCPAGWRVPSMSGGNPWAGFTKDNSGVFSKGYNWGDNAIYPGTGYRRGSSSAADISTEFIHVWSGSPNSNNPNNSTLFYGDRGDVGTISFGRANGASVRCVKE